MTAFATPAALIERYDSRTIGDLASDSGESIPEGDLAESSKVLQALEDASGRIQAAASVGEQYTPEDLIAMTGNDKALLERITCELAMVYLMERRAHRVGDERLQQVRASAEEYIMMLRNGERVFALDANKAASRADTDGPSTIDFRNMNLIPDRTNHYYPQRKQRLPIGR